MNSSLILTNIGLFSLQAAVVILAGLLAARVLRLTRPLLFLQVLLAAVLLLPLLQTWHRPVIAVGRVASGRIAMPATMLQRVDAPVPVNWPMIVLAVIAFGVLVRVIWLLFGWMRLRSMRWDAVPVGDGLAVSTEIAGPVTFGFLCPLILLPPEVMELPLAEREAILAHERAHVRRRDWLFALAEEMVLCVLWFHPAVWLLIGRIRLVREQVVDWAACREAGSRDVYVDALMAVAGARLQPYLAPAPQFLQRRQLSARIQSLLVEVPMSRLRMVSSYGAAAALLIGLTVWVTASYPLRGAPQLREAGSDNVSVQGAELRMRVPPHYPDAAREAKVEGPVTIDLSLSSTGDVIDAHVVAGPPELRNAALTAVLKWRFVPGPATARVVIDFRMPTAPDPNVVRQIYYQDSLPPALVATLRSLLQPYIGRPYSPEIASVLNKVAPEATMHVEAVQTGAEPGMILYIGQGPMQPVRPPADLAAGRLFMSGAEQAQKFTYRVDPAYPALARHARIQGTVRFDAVIDKSGAVSHLSVRAGHPLLIPAATDAARQFRYMPAVRNGQPVEVSTQIDVNFTL